MLVLEDLLGLNLNGLLPLTGISNVGLLGKTFNLASFVLSLNSDGEFLESVPAPPAAPVSKMQRLAAHDPFFDLHVLLLLDVERNSALGFELVELILLIVLALLGPFACRRFSDPQCSATRC